jgi:hypothetical protein
MQAKSYSPKFFDGGIRRRFGVLPKGGHMPGNTATISRDLRDGIYELVRNHLGGIGDVWIALEQNKDFAGAERLGIEFGEDFRLLDDIGWRPSEDKEMFELTMPPDDLVEVLERLRGDARRLLAESPSERRALEEDRETNERFRFGLDACQSLLAELDRRKGESA